MSAESHLQRDLCGEGAGADVALVRLLLGVCHFVARQHVRRAADPPAHVAHKLHLLVLRHLHAVLVALVTPQRKLGSKRAPAIIALVGKHTRMLPPEGKQEYV